MPYGAGSTRGMTQRHFEAIADTVRDDLARATTDAERSAIRGVINHLAARFAAGNGRFSVASFVNAATDRARAGGPLVIEPASVPADPYGDMDAIMTGMREMLAALREGMQGLHDAECTFWACDGPDEPYTHMKTCRPHAAFQDMRDADARITAITNRLRPAERNLT